MKMAPMLTLLYISLIVIILFDALGTNNQSYDLNPYNLSSNQSGMWDLFFNPTMWSQNSFLEIIVNTVIISSVAVLSATVVAYLTKSDIALLSPLFLGVIALGTAPIVAIYHLINRELVALFLTTGDCCIAGVDAGCLTSVCTPSLLLTAIPVGVLAVYWVMVCLEWWTQRGTS